MHKPPARARGQGACAGTHMAGDTFPSSRGHPTALSAAARTPAPHPQPQWEGAMLISPKLAGFLICLFYAGTSTTISMVNKVRWQRDPVGVWGR